MDAFDEQINMIHDILDGKLSKEQTKVKIDEISKKYGDNNFTHYDLVKKDKPWTRADLDELHKICITGVASKDVYLYMAEISDYLKAKKKKNIIISLVVACVLVSIFVGILIMLNAE